MRSRLSFLLGLDILYVLLIRTTFAQSISSTVIVIPEPEPTVAVESSSPAPDPGPTSPTIFSSSTDDWVRPNASLGSAAPIIGGGPSCAQDCLAKAASGAGCSSFVDRQCICSSSTFRDLAKNCFGMSNCDASSASRALNDVNTLCQAGQAFTDVFRSSSSSHSSSSQSRPELNLLGSKYRVNQPPGGANIRPFIRRDTHYLRHADYAYRRDNDSPHTTHRHRRGKARM